jgi:hypothetical protein
MDWEDVAFLIGQAVDELLAKIDEGVVEHVTIGSQLLGKAHHARVGVKFGDTVAGVRLRKPSRDRHTACGFPAGTGASATVQAAISRQTKRARMRFIAGR